MFVFLYINHRRFYLKNNVSETGLYLRLQVEHTHLEAINTASSYLRTPAPVQVQVQVILQQTISQPVRLSVP
jgi:hypothetical protein